MQNSRWQQWKEVALDVRWQHLSISSDFRSQVKKSGPNLGTEKENAQLAHTKALGSSRKARAHLGRLARWPGFQWKGWPKTYHLRTHLGHVQRYTGSFWWPERSHEATWRTWISVLRSILSVPGCRMPLARKTVNSSNKLEIAFVDGDGWKSVFPCALWLVPGEDGQLCDCWLGNRPSGRVRFIANDLGLGAGILFGFRSPERMDVRKEST